MARTRPIDESSLSVFAQNLRRMIGGASVNAWATKHNLIQSTVNRIVTGEMDPTLSAMERIAAAVGTPVWALLVPDMDPQNPPVIRDATDAERRLYLKLKATLDELAEIREGGNTRPGSLNTLP